MDLTITLRGERPLLMHNGRLANPLDYYARELKKINGKRKKTDDDYANLMRIESRGGAWETEDGLLGIPNAAVWRSIYDAAKAFKLGEDIKKALLFDDLIEPLTIKGSEITVDDFLRQDNSIDYRSVKIQRVRTMRARPIVRDWESTHDFTLNGSVIDVGNLEPILERAGTLVGLGDWRPTYGTYTATLETA